MRKILSSIALFVLSILATLADPIEGEWEKADGSGRIVISINKSGELVGTISYVKDVARTIDSRNPDSTLKKRPLIGINVFSGIKKEGSSDTWSGGTIYDSATGKTYKCKLWLEDSDNLRMRGYMGISAIGRTADMKRYK